MGFFSNLFGPREPEIIEPPIKFAPKGELPEELDKLLYVNTRLLVSSALGMNAQVLLLTYTAQAVKVHYLIDGVLHEREAIDRESGGQMMAVLKVVAGLNLQERKPMQQGDFDIRNVGKKYKAELTAQLSKAGEKLMIRFDDGSSPPQKLDECGMRPQMLEKFKEIIAKPTIAVISAPSGGGFTTTFNASIRTVDRYLRNVVAVEDAGKEEEEVENSPITPYDPAQNESPVTVLPKLLRTYPDVICVRAPVNAESLDLLSLQMKQERTVLIGAAAKDCVEAVMRTLALKCDRKQFILNLGVVLNQRLVRMLCEHCKQKYPPPPQLLKQLGVPAGSIPAFYRQGPPPQPPLEEGQDPEEVEPVTICPRCNGIGYRGRTAVYEMLVVDDAMRKAFLSTNDQDKLRQLARKAGNASMMDELLVAAARGVTDVKEVVRVMKE